MDLQENCRSLEDAEVAVDNCLEVGSDCVRNYDQLTPTEDSFQEAAHKSFEEVDQNFADNSVNLGAGISYNLGEVSGTNQQEEN